MAKTTRTSPEKKSFRYFKLWRGSTQNRWQPETDSLFNTTTKNNCVAEEEKMDLTLTRQLRKKYPSLETKNFARGSEKFHKTSSDLGNTLEVLRGQMKELQREIRADRVGKKEFEDQIALLKRKRELIQKNYNDNAAWAKEFDVAIGPFEKTYHTLTGEISGLYDNAKAQHAKGVELLIEEFKYHPAFKRWNDTFSAIPFRPK